MILDPVNSQVNRFTFDNLPFILKYSTIDDIVDEMSSFNKEIYTHSKLLLSGHSGI